jgi:hypothetical protein
VGPCPLHAAANLDNAWLILCSSAILFSAIWHIASDRQAMLRYVLYSLSGLAGESPSDVPIAVSDDLIHHAAGMFMCARLSLPSSI